MIKKHAARNKNEVGKALLHLSNNQMLSGTKKKSKKLLESFHEATARLYGMKVMDGKEAAKPRAEE